MRRRQTHIEEEVSPKSIPSIELAAAASRSRGKWLATALGLIAFLAMPTSIATDAPNIVELRAARAREIVDELRAALGITSDVSVVVVTQHPLVFSVEPVDRTKNHFVL